MKVDSDALMVEFLLKLITVLVETTLLEIQNFEFLFASLLFC